MCIFYKIICLYHFHTVFKANSFHCFLDYFYTVESEKYDAPLTSIYTIKKEEATLFFPPTVKSTLSLINPVDRNKKNWFTL